MNEVETLTNLKDVIESAIEVDIAAIRNYSVYTSGEVVGVYRIDQDLYRFAISSNKFESTPIITKTDRLDDKYSGINFRPSPATIKQAKRALKLIGKGKAGNGMEKATIDWVKKIAKGQPFTPDKVIQGWKWHLRNGRFAKLPESSPGGVAWAAWFGKAGKADFNRMKAEIDRVDMRKDSTTPTQDKQPPSTVLSDAGKVNLLTELEQLLDSHQDGVKYIDSEWRFDTKKSTAKVGDKKEVNGRTYVLNANKRWTRAKDEVDAKAVGKGKKVAVTLPPDAEAKVEAVIDRAKKAGRTKKKPETTESKPVATKPVKTAKEVKEVKPPKETKPTEGKPVTGKHEDIDQDWSLDQKKDAIIRITGMTSKQANKALSGLMNFTGGIYGEIRKFESGNTVGMPAKTKKLVKDFAEGVNAYLQKAPAFAGEMHRGMSFDSDADRKKFLDSISGGMELNAMSSFSSNKKIASDFGGTAKKPGVLIKIKNNKSAVSVKGFSLYPDEDEVLAPKGAKYRIVGNPKKVGNNIVVEMEEY